MEHLTVKRSKCHLGYRSRGLMLQMPASMMVWRYISAHRDVLHVFGVMVFSFQSYCFLLHFSGFQFRFCCLCSVIFVSNLCFYFQQVPSFTLKVLESSLALHFLPPFFLTVITLLCFTCCMPNYLLSPSVLTSLCSHLSLSDHCVLSGPSFCWFL